MSSAVLVIAVGAGLACPLHMLWHMRRGRKAKTNGCCGDHGQQPAEDLRGRWELVGRELARREARECEEALP